MSVVDSTLLERLRALLDTTEIQVQVDSIAVAAKPVLVRIENLPARDGWWESQGAGVVLSSLLTLIGPCRSRKGSR